MIQHAPDPQQIIDVRADRRVFDAWQRPPFVGVTLRAGFKFDDLHGQATHTIFTDSAYKAKLWLHCIQVCDCYACARITTVKPTH